MPREARFDTVMVFPRQMERSAHAERTPLAATPSSTHPPQSKPMEGFGGNDSLASTPLVQFVLGRCIKNDTVMRCHGHSPRSFFRRKRAGSRCANGCEIYPGENERLSVRTS